MILSGMAFGMVARAFASASDIRLSSNAFPMMQPLMFPRRARETISLTEATPPEAITRREVIARSWRYSANDGPLSAPSLLMSVTRISRMPRLSNTVANVHRGNDSIGPETINELPQKGRRFGRRRADDDALDAAVEPRARIAKRAYAATDLDAEISPRQSAHDFRFHGATAARALQIDNMQTRASFDIQRVEHLFRRTIAGNPGELASRQPHGVSLEHVDRRDHVHWMKFLKRRRPATDDFSGWNCTPKILSLRTAAVNAPP